MRATPRHTLPLRISIVLVASLVCSLSLGLPGPGAASPPPIAIIGVDAADWQTIDPLVAAGRLPAFRALKAVGGVGTMRAEPPLLSPIIWTTIATGRRPEDHGVLDFLVDQPGGNQTPIGSDSRRTKALWEIFSDAGRPSLVAGWWATWPPDPVKGILISDRLAVPHLRLESKEASDARLVYPPARFADVTPARVLPSDIDYRTLNGFVPLTAQEFDEAVASERGPVGLYRNRFAHARAALAATRTYGAVTAKLLPATRPSFVAVYFELVDTVSHLFVGDDRRRGAAISSAYAEVDRQIQTIARTLDPDTVVLVMSDHGFYPATAGIPDDPSDLTSGAAAWHRPYGIIAATTAGLLSSTRPATTRPALGTISPLDVAPTVLALAELPIAGDMPGRVVEALGDRSWLANTRTIPSYGPHRSTRQAAPTDPKTATELQRLRSLGYVSGTSPVTARSHVNLGELLFRRGAIKEAIAELEPVVRADPLDDRAGLWLARAYASADRPDEAVHVYDRLLQTAKVGHDVDPIVVLAATDLDVGRNRLSDAAARLARLPVSFGARPEVLLARGALADATGKPAEAERLFRAALASQPASYDALSRLVDLLLRTGRGVAAAQAAGDSARRFPDSPERLALVGETALAEHRPADAARALRSALALAPDAASVRVEVARAELMQDHADLALQALDNLAGRDADMLRGAADSMKGEWLAAVQAYERAAARGQPSVDLLNALGNAQLEAGRPADAAATLERSLALKAEQPAIRALADRARQRAGRSKP